MEFGNEKISFNINETPLKVWYDKNKRLEEFYKIKNINLTDSPEDLRIKNTMRHITGLATLAKYNSPNVTRSFGYVKEVGDIAKDSIKHPFFGVSKNVVNDTNIDFYNNDLGIDYTLQNPNASFDDIMNFAYQEAQKEKNYPKSYLLKYLGLED